VNPSIWKKNGGIYLGFACSTTEFPPENLQPRPMQYVGDHLTHGNRPKERFRVRHVKDLQHN
jgi:hypothetical protein